MCQSEEDQNQRKLNAVATFVGQVGEVNFRGQLLGLARAGNKRIIEEDLASDRDLNRYLEGSGFTWPLSEDEQKFCSDWGVKAADNVKNDPPRVRDEKIAQRLRALQNPDGTNPAGIGPIGA